MAANLGLYRYDGRSFKHYKHSKQRGNAVFGVTQDDKARTWCNNIAGQFFYATQDSLELFIDLSHKLNGELSEFVVTEEELIVFPGKGSIRVNLTTKKITDSYRDTFFIGSVKEHASHYNFTKGNYMMKVDKRFHSLDSLEIDVFENYAISSKISKRVQVFTSEDIDIFYFIKNGKNIFYTFCLEEKTYNRIAIPESLLQRSICHTFFLENEIWFSTDNGVFVCTYTDDRLVLKNHFFEKKFITKIIRDHQANYWLTTKGNGIIVIPNINIFQYGNTNETLNISSLEKINDQYLMYGTNQGEIGHFNTVAKKFTSIDTSSVYRVSELTHFPAYDETLIFKEDVTFAMNNQTFQLKEVNVLGIMGAKSFSKVNDTAYVLSSYKRAELLNSSFELREVLLKKRSYTNHYSLQNNTIYIGTIAGLFAIDGKLQKTEIKFENKPIIPKTIVETFAGTIWVSTFNQGLFGIKQQQVFAVYDHKNGLLSNTLNSIKNDGDDLWIVTDEGIQFFNAKWQVFKNLTKQNGVPSYRVSDIEIVEDEVYFATNTGLFSVDKGKGFKNDKIPEVQVTQVHIGLETVPLKKKYQLKHNENSIRFVFNANGFQSFLNNKYQFRLLGQDDTWQTDDVKSNAVNYYNLASGDYTFQVKSIVANEGDSRMIDEIKFSIAKPFWTTWWFYASIIIGCAALVYVIFKQKIKKLKKEQSQTLQKELINKQLVLSQLENLRSQMNPHFIFNALNSIQEYIVLNEKDLASSYLIKFSRLIRIYLDHSRENEVLLSEEIKALQIYLELEKNRFEDVLQYTILVSDQIKALDLKIPSLFIQPYVENAIKHGLLHKKQDRQLEIEFTLNTNENELYCRVADNGIGVEASKEINKSRYPNHNSFATSANEKRVALLNANRTQKITVTLKSLKSNTENGTEVFIKIPLKNESTYH
ncbi:MAG: histidine kinase [Bacteroidota bacterium]